MDHLARMQTLPLPRLPKTHDRKNLVRIEKEMVTPTVRAVPRIFCLRGQTPQTFTGISCIQTGFLVKHYVRKKKVFLAGATASPAPPLCMALVTQQVKSRIVSHSCEIVTYTSD